MNHVVVIIATANRRSKMKNILKLILSAIFIFGSVPTLNASDMKMDNMEEIKKKKKKYVLSGSFNLTNTPEESPMYGTFSIEENKYVYSIAISRIAFNIKSSRS